MGQRGKEYQEDTGRPRPYRRYCWRGASGDREGAQRDAPQQARAPASALQHPAPSDSHQHHGSSRTQEDVDAMRKRPPRVMPRCRWARRRHWCGSPHRRCCSQSCWQNSRRDDGAPQLPILRQSTPRSPDTLHESHSPPRAQSSSPSPKFSVTHSRSSSGASCRSDLPSFVFGSISLAAARS